MNAAKKVKPRIVLDPAAVYRESLQQPRVPEDVIRAAVLEGVRRGNMQGSRKYRSGS